MSEKSYLEYKDTEKPILGIDFGGSSCAAAYYYKGAVNIITSDKDQSDFNSKTMPTYVGFGEDKKYIIGHVAKKMYNDSNCTVFNKIKQKIYENQDFLCGDQLIKPHLLITELFNFLKKKAELEVGLFITQCVLTTPANFGQQTKTVLKEAANMANLEVLRFIAEPTAAALYYSRYVSSNPQTCLIVDLGSMTLDMTICHISKEFIDVEHTAGDPTCGFTILDQKIKDHLKQILLKKHNITEYNLNDDFFLLNFAEKLKIEFCTKQNTIFVKRELELQGDKKFFLKLQFTEENMNEFIKVYLSKVKAVFNKLFKDSFYDPRDISKVLLIGGPAESNYVKKKIQELIDIPIAENVDNLFAVCKGAALYGAIICNYDKTEKILSDVTALSLGVETENNLNQIIIPANSRIPCSRRVEFTTSDDFQKCARINVLEGERLIAQHCKLLGTYILEDIEQNYKGTPVIEVEYSIDYNGVLKVQVTDLKSLSRKSGILKINQELSASQKKELTELALKHRNQDLNYINKIKSTEALKDLLNTYKDITLQGGKNSNNLEDQYIEALKTLYDFPLDYNKISQYRLIFEKFCYDHRNSNRNSKSDIKRL